MKSSLLKDSFREIKKTFSRFISIFSIVALGVSFFSGVKATCPDMKITADKYFDDYRLMDIRLVSTMGFDEDDVKYVRDIAGVEGIYPAYSMDALTNIQDRDLVLKVLSLPLNKVKINDESYINRVKLVDGRLPEKINECVVEKDKIVNSGFSIGSTIKLSSGTDKSITESLNINEFKIVGIVETPYYISFERGTSSIGSGKINSFIMIPQEAFNLPVYTDVFLTVDGARDVLSYDKNYDDIIEPVKTSLEDAGKTRADARYDTIISEANEKLDKNKKDLKSAEEKQEKELSSALLKLDKSKKQINDGEKKLSNKENEFNRTIKNAQNKINEGYEKLKNGEKEYINNLSAFNTQRKQAEKEFPIAEQQIAAAQEEIEKNQQQLDLLKAALTAGQYDSPEQKIQMEAQIALLEQSIPIAMAQLAVSKSRLETNKKALSDAEAELQGAKKSLDDSRAELDVQSRQLESSKKKALSEFAAAHRKLNSSKAQLRKGEAEYEKAKNESYKKLSDAREKISDAEQQIKDIKKPTWYILDRNTNPGFVDYGNAADRMDAIAEVFPVFFFLVAALVCLTTMTRMVDEQRTYIGTLKALGYSKISIASKYLMYALLASVTGSVFGFLVGFKLFPTVISNAYGIMYTLPHVITDFNAFYAVSATAFAVLSTTLSAWFACYKELMEAPAFLMRPKSPKAGKRVFMERIRFIWSRLNFTQKVTARNLFRYKRRFFMTILGIGGCTALLVSGFGLKDSIMSIVTKQFEELYKYDMVIGFKNDITSSEIANLTDTVSKDHRITSCMLMREQSVDVGFSGNQKTVSIIVPEDDKKLQDFIVLRDRSTKKEIPFNDDGIVLTEKLSKQLNASVGDEIYIKDGDTKRINVKVSGITENYVSHYIYMSPVLYNKLYGKKPEFQQMVAKLTDTTEDFENNISIDYIKNKNVSSISFTTGISKNFEDIISSLNYVVLVLIFSAGALAFVVLYNLTNINITERLREIATIKVLGFYDNEVSAYVYRENVILTLIGIALGLILGIFLHRFIVVTAEVDYVMFGREIKPLSYIYSSILTILFSAMVNIVMFFKLKKISMVESLKSVD